MLIAIVSSQEQAEAILECAFCEFATYLQICGAFFVGLF